MLLSEGAYIAANKSIDIRSESSERLQKHGRPLDAVSLLLSFVSQQLLSCLTSPVSLSGPFFPSSRLDSGGRVGPSVFTPNLPS